MAVLLTSHPQILFSLPARATAVRRIPQSSQRVRSSDTIKPDLHGWHTPTTQCITVNQFACVKLELFVAHQTSCSCFRSRAYILSGRLPPPYPLDMPCRQRRPGYTISLGTDGRKASSSYIRTIARAHMGAGCSHR